MPANNTNTDTTMTIDKTREAVCYNGGAVNISMLPTPRVRTVTITEELPMYVQEDGTAGTTKTKTRAKRQVRNDRGQPLFVDENGDTVNRTSRDGTTVNPPKEETYTQTVTRTETVYDKDGKTPLMHFADISARLPILDTKGRPFPDSDTFTEDALTEDQKSRLIAVWTEVLEARAKKAGLYATPEAAKAAGALSDG